MKVKVKKINHDGYPSDSCCSPTSYSLLYDQQTTEKVKVEKKVKAKRVNQWSTIATRLPYQPSTSSPLSAEKSHFRSTLPLKKASLPCTGPVNSRQCREKEKGLQKQLPYELISSTILYYFRLRPFSSNLYLCLWLWGQWLCTRNLSWVWLLAKMHVKEAFACLDPGQGFLVQPFSNIIAVHVPLVVLVHVSVPFPFCCFLKSGPKFCLFLLACVFFRYT